MFNAYKNLFLFLFTCCSKQLIFVSRVFFSARKKSASFWSKSETSAGSPLFERSQTSLDKIWNGLYVSAIVIALPSLSVSSEIVASASSVLLFFLHFRTFLVSFHFFLQLSTYA